MRSRFLLFFCLLAVGTGCRRTTAVHAAASPAPPSLSSANPVDPPMPDACTLLTSAEIEAALGEPLKETKPEAKASGGFEVSQCFFTLPTAVNSAHLSVTRKGRGPDAQDPKAFWEKSFGHEAENEREEGERKSKPLKVENLGDEAFWSGNLIGGALYVLKGNRYLRISVGGSGDQETKIKKTRALAECALKRM